MTTHTDAALDTWKAVPRVTTCMTGHTAACRTAGRASGTTTDRRPTHLSVRSAATCRHLSDDFTATRPLPS